MAKILGLDLGTNSIGWAIRDTMAQGNQIIDKGVLTFEKGVAEGKSGEFPMVQKRTESRGKRRNYQAEKYRKWELLKILIENGMCPLSIEQLDEWRHYKKGVGRKYPQTDAFIQWLRFDFDGDGKPDFERFGFDKHESLYVFRMLASGADEQIRKIFQNEPHILGRVLYQLVQRRGFRGRDEEESKTIMEGGGAKGVNEIAPYLEKYRTLGAALYHLQKETGQRIRKRYNLRSDYEQELRAICEVHEIGEDLYKRLWKAIIWQRPLRSQKGLVGICTFERAKSRAPISHPLYEEYRTWVFINNLKIALPAGVNREEYLTHTIYPLFYNTARDFKLKKIRDRLKKDGGEIEAKFNDDTKVISCTLLNEFQKLLGADWKEKYGWYEALANKPQSAGYSFEDIWHVLATFDSKEKLKEFALQKLVLSEEDAEQFSKIKLPQGYATLSLAAIKKLLPYLKRGFKYSHAVYLANMHKAMGVQSLNHELAAHLSETFSAIEKQVEHRKKVDEIVGSLIADHQNAAQRWGMDPAYQLDDDDRNDIEKKAIAVLGEKTWEGWKAEEKEEIRQSVVTAYQTYLQQRINTPLAKIFPKKERLHDAIFKHLQETYNLPDGARKLLWHPSEQEKYAKAQEVNGVKFLGDPQPISRGFKNPMALKTLHQLKKLVNYLLQTGKIDEDTRIVIEIARELNDANRRKAIERWQREREKENDEYRKRIQETLTECGVDYDINKELLDKYRLWLEQNRHCLYTGKQIGFCEWFNGNLYDFEHTIPASMSFDNELKNLTLADGLYNKQIKGNRLPTELPNYYDDIMIDGKEYTAIKPRLKFMEEKVEALEKLLDDWVKKTSDDKSIKDAIIQRRHMIRMDLDYWRRKLETFTITEYKAGWRNSQLRDTQVITKYALPYLKTVFNRVDVQKGSVTAAFREIYKILPRLEKKDRTKHSHHAIDAAVLTLMPPAAIRDKILLRYNEEKDNNRHNTYHEPVRDWRDFRTEHILGIEDDVLINFQPKQRTLTPTYKNVRKRGRQQFVKEKTADGKWQFKLDEQGKPIPLQAKGDSIRGQLHEESFMTIIRLPEYKQENDKFMPITDGNGKFVFQKKNGEDEFFVVKKIPLTDLDSLEKFKKIVDPNLRSYLTQIVKSRMENGKNFQQAILEPIWAFDKKEDRNGNVIQPLRHIRCRVAKAAGYLSREKTLTIRKHDFSSKYDYKNDLLAANDEMAVCLFYANADNRAFKLISRFELANMKIRRMSDFFFLSGYDAYQKEGVFDIPLQHVIEPGTKVILLDDKINSAELLKTAKNSELLGRLYVVNNFNIPSGNTVYIYLVNHIDARRKEDLQKEEAKNIDLNKYQAKLALTASKFSCVIENKHFKVNPDGEIKWLV